MGTSWVRVQVGTLVKHDIPIPDLQVFDVLPVPVWVTCEYSNEFKPTLYTVHDRYT